MLKLFKKKEEDSPYIERKRHPRMKEKQVLYIEEGTLQDEGDYYRVGRQKFNKHYYQVVLTAPQ
jgi:hypothetical protein